MNLLLKHVHRLHSQITVKTLLGEIKKKQQIPTLSILQKIYKSVGINEKLKLPNCTGEELRG